MEDWEFEDWGITPSDTSEERRRKSISAYYLPQWYSQISELTFPTHIYPLITEDNLNQKDLYQSILASLPKTLPFHKCMVRYEHKSPKDSSLWGPVHSPEEAAKLFTTSLTCLKSPGKYLCVREWQIILAEYRCFWKEAPNLIESLAPLNKDQAELILNYLKTVQIPYHRCVIDLAETSTGFKIIEFNSWETLSRGYHLDWVRDTHIIDSESSDVVFYWSEDQLILPWLKPKPKTGRKLSELEPFQILPPSEPSCWLITEKYIYICTEIWLGQFNHDLKSLAWKRGQYRFDPIYPCDQPNYISAGGEILDECLQPVSSYLVPFPKIDLSKHSQIKLPRHSRYRYGFVCSTLNTSQLKFCRMFNDGTFQLVELD